MWFETDFLETDLLPSTTVEILMWFETVDFAKSPLLSTTVEILMWFETVIIYACTPYLQQ